jgi:hypothetical protein
MKVTPIRFVRNIELANKFYSTLGLNENAAATSGTWADMRGDGGQLGLHIGISLSRTREDTSSR